LPDCRHAVNHSIVEAAGLKQHFKYNFHETPQ